MKAILLVEDDATLARGLIDNLRFEGYRVVHANTGEVAVQHWRRERFDLVLLDLMLPGISGFDVLRSKPDADPPAKVVVLSARDGEHDVVRALDLGACDYLRKPFGLAELLARLRARLRESEGGQDAVEDVQLGDAWVRTARFRIERGGEVHLLSHTEVRMLELFLAHRGRPLRRLEILRHAWGEHSSSGTRTVDNFVLKLRKKLEADPARPRFLRTVHGVGYVLLGGSGSGANEAADRDLGDVPPSG